jgi:hypothetical protein
VGVPAIPKEAETFLQCSSDRITYERFIENKRDITSPGFSQVSGDEFFHGPENFTEEF